MPVHGRIHVLAVMVMLTGLGYARPSEVANGVTLELAAGDFDRENVPVAIELPASLRGRACLGLTRVDNGQTIAVQVYDRGTPSAAWILRDRLPAGEVRRYRLVAATGRPAATAGVSVQDDGKQLLVKVGKKPVLVYNQAVVPSPDAEHPYYARSGYIHPVYNPSGKPITDDFNPDHAHHHGIMFAWRKTTFEGRSTNGWDQKGVTGRVEHVSLEDFGDGAVFGFFTVRMRHVDLTAPGGAKPVLDEKWHVRVYNLSDRFLFDIESTQTCASGAAVVIEEASYGGLMIRGHARWQEEQDFNYCTSEGKPKEDGNPARPLWVDMYGPLNGKATGVAILDHPGNFRFPQPARMHSKMPYFCFAPAILGSFSIVPDQPYVSRYRFRVHQGEPNPTALGQLWQDYAHPVTVRVVAAR